MVLTYCILFKVPLEKLVYEDCPVCLARRELAVSKDTKGRLDIPGYLEDPVI